VSDPYPVCPVNIEDKSQIEQMGTKRKFWCFDSEGGRWLFKYNRPNTGEDWSEKIASEIAELIGLPHAITRLAECEGQRGVLSKDFTEGKTRGYLVHGNELLTIFDPDYPSDRFRKVSQHSIENIIRVLQRAFIRLPRDYSFPANIGTAVDLFLGYLMLDALIGNTDRHHENWGLLVQKESSEQSLYAELAPTFDHASSLGRELEEARREALLVDDGHGTGIPTYAQRGRSAIYLDAGDKRPLSTLDAFVKFSNYELPASHASPARNIWLDKLRDVTEDSLHECVRRVPGSLWGPKSCEFVWRLLMFNRGRLLSL